MCVIIDFIFDSILLISFTYKCGIFYRLRTCGVISPNITINSVDAMTATMPDVNPSSKMVNVELTSTLPRRILHSK